LNIQYPAVWKQLVRQENKMRRILLLTAIAVTLTFSVLRAQDGRTPFTTSPLRPFELKYRYVGTGEAEGLGCRTEMKMTLIMLNSIDLTSPKMGESPNPPYCKSESKKYKSCYEPTKKSIYSAQTTKAESKGESNCPLCALGHDANKSKIWKVAEMDADHVTAWSKGGETKAKNCQMLCKTHNRAKGNR
jgi:5-methylcytosine-specific restriction endonuclease McrA